MNERRAMLASTLPSVSSLDCRTAFVLDEEGLKPLKNY